MHPQTFHKILYSASKEVAGLAAAQPELFLGQLDVDRIGPGLYLDFTTVNFLARAELIIAAVELAAREHADSMHAHQRPFAFARIPQFVTASRIGVPFGGPAACQGPKFHPHLRLRLTVLGDAALHSTKLNTRTAADHGHNQGQRRNTP